MHVVGKTAFNFFNLSTQNPAGEHHEAFGIPPGLCVLKPATFIPCGLQRCHKFCFLKSLNCHFFENLNSKSGFWESLLRSNWLKTLIPKALPISPKFKLQITLFKHAEFPVSLLQKNIFIKSR
ncbi:hypothetical protein C7N43_12265 [Sphingobacteriales bacterium UPWRP_1]|nr:hypothetical protein B6N25_13950 [Sphingobacteriales bacterium TSM_CSS]PSJ76716.1 hypothetical protein C7N43_12265 [Sphingobacteriales bacterium UPWRP_1]